MSCGAETEANDLLTSLTAGVDFSVPDVDLDSPEFEIPVIDVAIPNQLTNADLTTGIPGGAGTFDVVMKSLLEHLKTEFEKGRITGAEYTKAYIEMTQAALGNAVQFLLGRDAAYWQAVIAQQQAQVAAAEVVKARVGLEIAKVQLMGQIFEARNQQANYALTKLKLATESVGYCIAQYNLENILPVQKQMLTEQMETARAQTLDNRTDGAVVVGAIGKQKDLHTQQVESYKRDAEVKAAKLFTDAWITQKTIDEGLIAPTNFANASLDAILADIKTANGIG